MISPASKILFLSMILAQSLALVFCGDITCLQGGVEKNCDALLCGLLEKHPPSDPVQAHPDQDEDCHCLCHSHFNLPKIQINQQQTLVADYSVTEPTRFFTVVPHQIYRPPMI